MKKRNQERIAKIFAVVVVLIMVFQVLLPLFNSVTLNSSTASADVTSGTAQAAPAAAATSNQQVNVSTTTPANVITVPAKSTK